MLVLLLAIALVTQADTWRSPSPTCSVQATTPGGTLEVVGSGFAPNEYWLLYYQTPAGGTGESAVYSDANGHFEWYSYAGYSGTYTAQLYYRNHFVADCQPASVP